MMGIQISYLYTSAKSWMHRLYSLRGHDFGSGLGEAPRSHGCGTGCQAAAMKISRLFGATLQQHS